MTYDRFYLAVHRCIVFVSVTAPESYAATNQNRDQLLCRIRWWETAVLTIPNGERDNRRDRKM